MFVHRRTLPDDAPDYFDAEVSVLVATVVINVVNQVCYFLLFAFLYYAFVAQAMNFPYCENRGGGGFYHFTAVP